MKLTNEELKLLNKRNKLFLNTPELHELPDNIKIIICRNYALFNDFHNLFIKGKRRICDKLKYEDLSGYWETYEYNSDGTILKFSRSNGYWEIREYDKNRKLSKLIYSDGSWLVWEYDKNENKTKYESSSGYWETYEYNKDGKTIRFENSNDYWKTWNYDEDGKIMKIEESKRIIDTFDEKKLKEISLKQKYMSQDYEFILKNKKGK